MGGRLAHFVEKWEEITDIKWVLSIIGHGFRILFSKIPPLSSVPIRMSQSSSPFIREEIENLLNKRAVERVQNRFCVEVWVILNWCLEHDIVIRVRHIPGKFNILADRLSRLDKPIKTEWALDQTVANLVFQMLNFPNVDLFATRFNHKLPLYVSPVHDNKALVIDALSMDWNHLHAYAFPPFILMPAVLEKIRQHQCRIVLIALFWPQQQWFSELLLLLVSAPIRLPLIPRLLTQSKEDLFIKTSQFSIFTLGSYQTINQR